jgi:hypothetical protein
VKTRAGREGIRRPAGVERVTVERPDSQSNRLGTKHFLMTMREDASMRG